MNKISNKPKVLVDMDGVLAQFDAGVEKELRARHPEVKILTNRKNFYFRDDYPKWTNQINSIAEEPGFFRTFDIMPGAIEGWQRIIDAGYHPQICTAPLRRNPTCAADKLLWLEEHFVPVFGPWVVEQAIVDKQKHLYDGVAIIEDRPELQGSNLASWQQIMFDREYNKQISTEFRLFGWMDPKLPELLDRCEELSVKTGGSAAGRVY